MATKQTQRLWVDQYGNKFYAATITELRAKHGITGKVSKLYVDGVDGNTYHTGYVIGAHWFTVYTPMRIKQ